MKTSITINKRSAVFYIAVFLLTLSLSLFVNINSTLFYFVKFLSFCLLIVNVFLDRKKLSEIILLSIFILISIVSYTKNLNTDILTLTLVVVSCSSFNFYTAIKVQLIARVTGIIATIGMFLSGIIPDHILYREDGSLRHSLGYIHPNSLSTHFAYAVFAYLFLRGRNIKYSELFVIFILNWRMNEVTGTRTSFLSVLLIVVLISLYKIFKNKKLLFINKINWFSVSFLFSIVGMYLFSTNNSVASLIDELFSGRLRQGYAFLSEYGISVMGEFIQTGRVSSGRVYILDNMYVKMLVQYGLLLSFYYVGVLRYIKDNLVGHTDEFILHALLLVLSIYGISESSPLQIEVNFLLFAMAKYIKDIRIPLRLRSYRTIPAK